MRVLNSRRKSCSRQFRSSLPVAAEMLVEKILAIRPDLETIGTATEDVFAAASGGFALLQDGESSRAQRHLMFFPFLVRSAGRVIGARSRSTSRQRRPPISSRRHPVSANSFTIDP